MCWLSDSCAPATLCFFPYGASKHPRKSTVRRLSIFHYPKCSLQYCQKLEGDGRGCFFHVTRSNDALISTCIWNGLRVTCSEESYTRSEEHLSTPCILSYSLAWVKSPIMVIASTCHPESRFDQKGSKRLVQLKQVLREFVPPALFVALGYLVLSVGVLIPSISACQEAVQSGATSKTDVTAASSVENSMGPQDWIANWIAAKI